MVVVLDVVVDVLVVAVVVEVNSLWRLWRRDGQCVDPADVV